MAMEAARAAKQHCSHRVMRLQAAHETQMRQLQDSLIRTYEAKLVEERERGERKLVEMTAELERAREVCGHDVRLHVCRRWCFRV